MRSLALPVALVVAAACSSSEERSPARSTTAVVTAAPADAAPVVADAAAADARPPADAAPPPAPPGADFAAQVRLLHRVAACAGDAPIPDRFSARTVASFCRTTARRKQRYKQRYVEVAGAYIAARLPDGLPKLLVYPFAGGDLMSALVAFPDSTEITTLSLEHAGDVRAIDSIGKRELADSLAAIREQTRELLGGSNSRSTTLIAAQKNKLPTLIVMFLLGLDMHGFEPVSLRYFRLEPDGGIHYYTADEIAALEDDPAGRLKSSWSDVDFSRAFSHVEIGFRERDQPTAPIRYHRHIAANLDDRHLARSPEVIRHLAAKGTVTAMTKAAAYLLWRDDFSTIRDYLLDHMAFMLSDSTGIPPAFARPRGWKYRTFGRYRGALGLRTVEKHDRAFQELWKRQKYERIGFRFGYIDAQRAPHLLFTYK